jgi:very-short-patch-repair endonuclease
MTRSSFPRASPSRRQAVAQMAEYALAELLTSRLLRDHRLVRQCAIGPYVLDYVYSEKALVVELRAADREEGRAREAVRHAFLAAMGYTVLSVSPAELLQRPTVILAQVRTALSRS